MSELTEKRFFRGLSNNKLKIIAMICMAIDHIGLMFFPNMIIWRCIGRISFPIYAYMIAEGCRYTKNRKKYFGIIAIMALIFQIVYFVFMNGSIYQGILVNFSLSILAIFAIDTFIRIKSILVRISMTLSVAALIFIQVGFPILFKEYGFEIDYGIWGFLIPIAVYFIPKKLWRVIAVAALLVIRAILSTKSWQWWSLLSIPLFLLYNEQRGSKKMKYVFYVFYPLHLVIIYGVYFLLAFYRYI